jgi:hypothetical protein
MTPKITSKLKKVMIEQALNNLVMVIIRKQEPALNSNKKCNAYE